MKFKKLLGGGLLATVLALGVGAGLAVHSESKAANATNLSRYSVMIDSSSWWLNENATTWIEDGETGYTAQLTVDNDLGETVQPYSASFKLFTGLIDLDQLGSSYDKIMFKRKSADGQTTHNTVWAGWREGIKTGVRNLMEINSNTDFNEWQEMRWKLTTYSGSTLSTVNYTFAKGGASVADPTDIPAGMSFAHWCTDAALENEWTGSTVTSDLTLYAKYASNVFDITKKIYHDDSFISESADHVEEGQSYTPATPADEVGYIFKGWYEYDSVNDKPSSTPVTTIASVTSNQTICGVYASRGAYTHDGYVYYVADIEGDAQTPNTIYSYGGHNEFGSWPGTAITSVGTDVHGSLGFEGYANEGYTRHIYKIPYTTAFSDTHIIIVYNGGKSSGGDQTADMTLVNKGTYWWESTTGNTDAGKAIDFLIEAEDIRNDASYKTLNYSVCGISKTDATTLVGKYDNLGDGAAYVDRSYTYTYDPSKSAEEQKASKVETAVQYSLIIAKLREIASGNGPSANTKGISLFGDIDNSTPIMLVVIISVVSLTAVGGYIFLKRRKEN